MASPAVMPKEGVATLRDTGDAPGPDVEGELRRGVERGRPSHALLDAWPEIGDFAAQQTSVLADILRRAGAGAPDGPSAALVEPDAVAFALLDSAGRARKVGKEFLSWVGDPAESVDCRDLARRARSAGSAIGTAQTLDHGALALLALRGPAATGWPMLFERLGQRPGPSDLVLVVFAPSRSEALALRTAHALGLTPLESRLAAAMLVAPTLDSAAQALGIGRETAKDALEGAMRKTGARRAQELVGRLVDLSCNVTATARDDLEIDYGVLGLSPVERAVARRLAAGHTAEEAALALGLKPGTVNSYRRTIFAKLGIGRARDLRRLMTEAGELGRLAGAEEVVSAPPAEAALRVFTDARGRSIACLDYGPPRGHPLLLMHGYSTGRTAPPPLLEALRARGRRVIVPQRPGFGLTTPADGDYVEAAVGDMALVLARLGCGAASILARDGGVASALAFAARHPERVRTPVLLNPRMPRESRREHRGPLTAIAMLLLQHPSLIEPFCAMMARQLGAEIQTGIFRRLLSSSPADVECFQDPAVAERLIADIRHLGGRSAEGMIAELRLFAHGWRPPAPYVGQRWRLVVSGDIARATDLTVWDGVAAGAPIYLEGAGLLAQFTHAEALASILDD